MTLSAGTTITITTSVTSAANRPSTSEIVVSDTSSGGVLKKYSLTSFVQVGANITTIASPQSVEMISADHAAVCASSGTTSAIVNVATGVNTSIGSMSGVYAAGSTGGVNQIAGDIANGIGFATSSTTGSLQKFVSGTLSGSLLTPVWLNSLRLSAIVHKTGTANFIGCTTNGVLVEFEPSAANSVRSMSMLASVFDSIDPASLGLTAEANSMAYANGILYVSSKIGKLVTIAWDTGKVIRVDPCALSGVALSNIITPTMVSIPNVNSNSGKKMLSELDAFTTPMRQSGFCFTPGYNTVCSVGLQNVSGTITAWVLGLSNTSLSTYTVSGIRSLTYQTSDALDPGAVEAEVVYIKDAGAVGDAEVEFVMQIPPGGLSIPLTAGSEYIKLAKIGTGVNAEYDCRRVTT